MKARQQRPSEVPIGEIFEVQLGKMLSGAAKTGACPYPYLANRNVQWGRVDVSSLETMDFDEDERVKFSLRPGDLLVCEGGEVGRTAIWNGELKDCYFQKAVHRLRPRDGRVVPRYMLHFMRHAADQGLFASWTSQTSIAHLTKEKLEQIRIPLLPMAEQRRIADILDKADAVRRKRQETIALTEEFLRSAFLEMFGDPVTNPKGWSTCPIEELASGENNALAIGPFGSNLLASDYLSQGHPVVFVRDIVTELFCWKSNVFVSATKFEQLSAHRARPGDVLVTKMGDPPGVACVFPEDFPPAIVTADVIKISVAPGRVLPGYLAAALNSSWSRHQIAAITAGVTRAKITLRDFRKIQVRVPPLGEQRRFLACCDRVGALRVHAVGGYHESQTLFAALEQQAFVGES